MKILVINYEFPPLGSGAANATWHICRGFARLGIRTLLVTSAWPGLPSHERELGCDILRIPVIRSMPDRAAPHEALSFALSSMFAAASAARSFRPDCSLALFAFPGGPGAWAVKQATGAPYVVSLRNADVPRPELRQNKLLSAISGIVMRGVCRRADEIVAVSGGLARAASAHLPGRDIRVIPNGVDAELFHPSTIERRSPDDPFTILYAGRLRAFKGVRDLILSFSEAQRRCKQRLCLNIVGDGPARSELESLADELGLARDIAFYGRAPRRAMPTIYRSADIFAFPSHAEGMPNAVLEALASGLPVIAADAEGSAELVADGENGFLVKRGDVKALARNIETLAADPDMVKRFSAAARERAMRFTWDAAVELYLDAMRRAVESRGKGRG